MEHMVCMVFRLCQGLMLALLCVAVFEDMYVTEKCSLHVVFRQGPLGVYDMVNGVQRTYDSAGVSKIIGGMSRSR